MTSSRSTQDPSSVWGRPSLKPAPQLDPGPDGAGLRDLAFARALAGTAQRLLEASDPVALHDVIVLEAATIIGADGVVLVRGRGREWQLLAPLALDPEIPCDPASTAARVLEAAAAGLLVPGQVDDLRTDPAWELLQRWGDALPWRSLLTVRLTPPRHSDVLLLVWVSRRPGCFSHQLDVAELFAGHADLALRSVEAQFTLAAAIERRHHVGLAQGILMARRGLTEDAAFALLTAISRQTNVKIRVLADQVVSTGEPPDLAPTSARAQQRARQRAQLRAQRPEL